MVSPFFSDVPGVEQGRVENPSGFTPTEGSAALVLGSDEPGREGFFDPFDTIEYAQTASIGTGKMLRFDGRIRGPSTMPAVSGDEPFALADGQTLELAIDEGGTQTVTFDAADFSDIGAATALEVRDAIRAQLASAAVNLTGYGQVEVRSLTTGLHSRVEVVGGTAAALAFAEYAWYARVVFDFDDVVTIRIRSGETRNLADLGGNLAAYGAGTTVRFRLYLGAV